MLKVLTAALLLVAVSSTAWSHPRFAQPVIVLRSYDGLGTADSFAVTRGRVEDILNSVGIGVSWVECGRDARPEAVLACQQPLRSNEFILRVVPAIGAHAAINRESLGYSLIDAHTRAGSVAAVYGDRIAALAHESNVDSGDLLARAVVHEIGHLLTGSTDHPRHGLMRARWTAVELRRNLRRDWQFSRIEADTMRETLLAASAPAAAEATVALH